MERGPGSDIPNVGSLGPRALLLLLLASATLPLGAATILVASREDLDGAPIPSRPVTEGVLAALFSAGQVAFDAPAPEQAGGLQDLARSAGADYALLLVATCSASGEPPTPPKISMEVEITLIDARSGATLTRGRGMIDNAGRERDVDLAALGMEAGREAATAVSSALAGEGPGHPGSGFFR